MVEPKRPFLSILVALASFGVAESAVAEQMTYGVGLATRWGLFGGMTSGGHALNLRAAKVEIEGGMLWGKADLKTKLEDGVGSLWSSGIRDPAFETSSLFAVTIKSGVHPDLCGRALVDTAESSGSDLGLNPNSAVPPVHTNFMSGYFS
jgi:hypothetical protein